MNQERAPQDLNPSQELEIGKNSAKIIFNNPRSSIKPESAPHSKQITFSEPKPNNGFFILTHSNGFSLEYREVSYIVMSLVVLRIPLYNS